MRWILVFLFLSSCSAFEKDEIVFPDKPLQEIIFYGDYYPQEDDREEEYHYSGRRYCYKRTEEDRKFESFNKISKGFLKAQLYSKEGRLLTETFFIMEKDDTIYNIYDSEAYLPYHSEAYEIHIVRVEGDKEILLNKWEVISIEDMVSKTIPFTEWQGIFWHYDPEIECHIAPGPR